MGLWFAVTGFVLNGLCFWVLLWKAYPRHWRSFPESEAFLYWVIVPSIVFALCGATIGASMLRLAGGAGNALAFMGLGATVSAAAIIIYVVGWAAFATITGSNPGLGQFVFLLIYLGALWGLSRLTPFALLGALSGWLLYCVKRRWID